MRDNQDLIEAWEDERDTNRYGLAHLAERALAVLRDQERPHDEN